MSLIDFIIVQISEIRKPSGISGCQTALMNN